MNPDPIRSTDRIWSQEPSISPAQIVPFSKPFDEGFENHSYNQSTNDNQQNSQAIRPLLFQTSLNINTGQSRVEVPDPYPDNSRWKPSRGEFQKSYAFSEASRVCLPTSAGILHRQMDSVLSDTNTNDSGFGKSESNNLNSPFLSSAEELDMHAVDEIEDGSRDINGPGSFKFTDTNFSDSNVRHSNEDAVTKSCEDLNRAFVSKCTLLINDPIKYKGVSRLEKTEIMQKSLPPSFTSNRMQPERREIADSYADDTSRVETSHFEVFSKLSKRREDEFEFNSRKESPFTKSLQSWKLRTNDEIQKNTMPAENNNYRPPYRPQVSSAKEKNRKYKHSNKN